MLFIAPSFEVIGEISETDFKEITEENPKPAALICVKYGPERAWRNDLEVNFINEVYVRLPFGIYIRIIEKFQIGRIVRIKGHLQGLRRHGDDSPRVELNAERISFPQDDES